MLFPEHLFVDTAFNYNNEDVIGNALKKWFEMGKGKREDLFITTKVFFDSIKR